jgi:prophage regulatory protein
MHFITLHEVVARTRLSRATIWRYVRAGRFPAPVRITTGSTRYVLEDVVAWMASQEGPACAATPTPSARPRRPRLVA